MVVFFPTYLTHLVESQHGCVFGLVFVAMLTAFQSMFYHGHS